MRAMPIEIVCFHEKLKDYKTNKLGKMHVRTISYVKVQHGRS